MSFTFDDGGHIEKSSDWYNTNTCGSYGNDYSVTIENDMFFTSICYTTLMDIERNEDNLTGFRLDSSNYSINVGN